MGNQIRVPRNETEVPINLTLTRGGPVSGATVVYAVRDGDTPDSWLDFNDSTFKTAAWTTRQASLTGSGTQSGLYTAVPGLDLTGITNLPAATDHLIVEYEVTAPSNATGIVSDIILLDDRVEDLNNLSANDVWSEAVPAAFGAGSAGFILGTNLDVVLSTRSSHVAADIWLVTGLETTGTYSLASAGGYLATVEHRMRNRVITDPVAGTYTISQDDNSTRVTGNLFQDAAGTVAYQGQGAERQDRAT